MKTTSCTCSNKNLINIFVDMENNFFLVKLELLLNLEWFPYGLESKMWIMSVNKFDNKMSSLCSIKQPKESFGGI